MLEFKFDWNKSVEIGIEEIDEQHKELFKIVREIEHIILFQANELTDMQILAQLCKIREYVVYHFYTEEKMMAEVCPEYLDEHKRQHEAFTRKINAINCIALVENPVEEFKKIKEMIQEWLFEHILVEDRKIAEATVNQ